MKSFVNDSFTCPESGSVLTFRLGSSLCRQLSACSRSVWQIPLRFQSFHLLQPIWKVICWRSVHNVLTCLFSQSRRFNGAEEHRLRDLHPCKSQTAALRLRATLTLCFLLSPPHRSCSRGFGGDDGVACHGLIWNKQNDRTYFLKMCNASDEDSRPISWQEKSSLWWRW